MIEKSYNSYAIPVILIIVALIFSSFFIIVYPKISIKTTYLNIGANVFNARLATNQKDREKGLSGVSKLKTNEALLMIFPENGYWGIWMKDMKIPIDVVWLDERGKVVYIVTDMAPGDSEEEVYKPSEPAKYVIEFPAGTVDSSSINEKSVASFAIDAKIKVE